MVNEINVIIGGAAGALLSGLAGLAISAYGVRHARRGVKDNRQELAWREHQSEDIARNLLVLEMIADEIESRPMDVAVRARLTPAELRKAARELTAAGLVDEPSPNLMRLTEDGRGVLNAHRLELEDSGLHRIQRRPILRSKQSPEDLDIAIEDAVAHLSAQHAHP